jgi:hypothetical protein
MQNNKPLIVRAVILTVLATLLIVWEPHRPCFGAERQGAKAGVPLSSILGGKLTSRAIDVVEVIFDPIPKESLFSLKPSDVDGGGDRLLIERNYGDTTPPKTVRDMVNAIDGTNVVPVPIVYGDYHWRITIRFFDYRPPKDIYVDENGLAVCYRGAAYRTVETPPPLYVWLKEMTKQNLPKSGL